MSAAPKQRHFALRWHGVATRECFAAPMPRAPWLTWEARTADGAHEAMGNTFAKARRALRLAVRASLRRRGALR